jgi:hypothetical protein
LAATVTWVWFHLAGVQPLVAWQLKQLVLPTGMCVAGLPIAELPSWQLAQLVLALKLVWSTLASDQVLVDLWQLSQLPLTLAWIGVFGLPAPGWKPPVWQVAQALVTLTLAWNLAGVQAP